MSTLAGEVMVAARYGAGCLRDVQVRSSRPSPATVFAGRAAGEVLALLPRLYAICARAHVAAARAALAAAAGHGTGGSTDAAVGNEALRELLFAVCAGPARAALPALLRAPPGEWRAALAAGLLGGPPHPWLEAGSIGDLEALAAGGSPLALELRVRLGAREPPGAGDNLLPATDAAATLATLPRLDAACCAQPSWMGAPAETGPWALLQSRAPGPLAPSLGARPLLQRWWARLQLVLAHAWTPGVAAPPPGWVSGASVAAGIGRGAAITARGLLLHEVELREGRVARWAILAPTEWNFHPHGALPRWLEGLPARDADDARAQVAACAAALDPCVPCVVRLAGA